MKKFLSLCAAATLGVALLASPASAEDAQTPVSAPETVVEVQTPPEPEIVSEEPAPVAEVAPPVEEVTEPLVEEAKQTGHDPVTVCHNGESLTFDDDAYVAHINHGDTEGVCVPVETFVPYAASARWLLPATWNYGTTPTYQAAIFPQDLLTTDVPACRWSQDDAYWLESEAEVALFESLDDDGVLTQGEDSAIYASHVFTAGPPCAPVVTNVCTPGQGDTSTNLNDLWSNVDTRSAGHLEYVDGGLHVWTDDASSQAKVSEGRAANFPLHDTGVIGLDWTGSTPPPGVNLFVNFGADGTGTLVYESVYGQDLWLTNGSSATVKANAPVNGGGNGSQWHGTIDQWLTVYPDAVVTGFAYSLGSGVHGDGVIHSVTVNCATYTFDFEREVPVKPEPVVDTTSWFEDTCVEPLDGTAVVVEYGQDVTTDWVWDAESWEWVAGEPVIGEVYVVSETTVENEECAAVVVPTPTPTVTVTPTATPTPVVAQVATAATLASTGTSGLGVVLAIGAGLILVGFGAWVFAAYRKQS